MTINGSLFSTQAGIDSVTSPLAARVLGTGLKSQPQASTMTGANGELDKLINTLCATTSCSTTPRALAVTAAACATAFGGADMLIN